METRVDESADGPGTSASQTVLGEQSPGFADGRGKIEKRDFSGASSLIDGEPVAHEKRVGIAGENPPFFVAIGQRSQGVSVGGGAGKNHFAVVPMSTRQTPQKRKRLLSQSRLASAALVRVCQFAPLRNIAPCAV